MNRSTTQRVLDLATAALAVVVVIEQNHGAGAVRLALLRGTWWAAARVASGAGRVAMAAELAYRREVAG